MENLNEKAGRHMERNQFSKVLKFLSTRTKSFTYEVKNLTVNQKTFCHNHAGFSEKMVVQLRIFKHKILSVNSTNILQHSLLLIPPLLFSTCMHGSSFCNNCKKQTE
jgi:hypothetical protein